MFSPSHVTSIDLNNKNAVCVAGHHVEERAAILKKPVQRPAEVDECAQGRAACSLLFAVCGGVWLIAIACRYKCWSRARNLTPHCACRGRVEH